MKDQITPKPGLAERFKKLIQKWRPGPIRLDILRAATKGAPHKANVAESLPGM
jgi:hypothetical protein